MEQESVWERLQRRQPLADLSKKSTGTIDFLYLPLSPFSFSLRPLEDTVNARSSAPPQVPLRVPPLKIKLLPSDTTVKPSNPAPSLESRFKCALKLDRLDLSAYNISNKPASPPAKEKKVIEPIAALSLPTTKTKPLTISKSHEHQKPLKRLNTAEPKKAFQIFKDKPRQDSISIRLSISKAPATSTKVTPPISPRVEQKSTPASVCQEKTATNKKKKKNMRPDVPPEYQCSIFLTRIDLSLYDVDLPDAATSTTTSPVITDAQTGLDESHLESGSTSGTLQALNERSVCGNYPTRMLFWTLSETSDSVLALSEEVTHDFECELIPDPLPVSDGGLDEPATETIDPCPFQEHNEPVPIAVDETAIAPGSNLPLPSTEQRSPATADAVLPQATINIVLPTSTDPFEITLTERAVQSTTNTGQAEASEETELMDTMEITQTSFDDDHTDLESSLLYAASSPDFPALDDDPVLFAMNTTEHLFDDPSSQLLQDCLLIVPCSDEDDDDFDDRESEEPTNNVIAQTPSKTTNGVAISSPNVNDPEPIASPSDNYVLPVLSNPSLMRGVSFSLLPWKSQHTFYCSTCRSCRLSSSIHIIVVLVTFGNCPHACLHSLIGSDVLLVDSSAQSKPSMRTRSNRNSRLEANPPQKPTTQASPIADAQSSKRLHTTTSARATDRSSPHLSTTNHHYRPSLA